MATADQLKSLIRSYSDGDEDRFFSIAIQIAAHAAKNGHGKLAEEIKTIVDKAKVRYRAPIVRGSEPLQMAQPRGELSGLLTAAYSKVELKDLVLPDLIKDRLQRVIFEQLQSSKLRQHNLRPRNHILLVGPPGTGKTMTAFALAGEMHLPVFTIRLEGLITKFMGETAAKLKLIFDEIDKTRGIFFFDEFDAIGGKRTLVNDVGEIRRVLNSFLQFIEQHHSDSLIIAATNHAELLDLALFRRFDDVLTFSLPSESYIRETIDRKLNMYGIDDLNWNEVVEAATGLSYADITRACEDAMKEMVLNGKKTITSEMLIKGISERKAPSR